MHIYKINKVVNFIIFAFLLNSCSESEFSVGESASSIARYLASSDSHINLGANVSSRKIQISTINTPWEIKNNSSWLTVSPAYGTSSATVLIESTENLSGDTARTQIMMLESADMDWKFNSPISVTQSAAVPYITPEETSIELPGRTNTYSVHVNSNTDWYPSCDQSFLSVKRDGDNLVLQADENTDLENGRWAEVFLIGSTTSSLLVVQSPADIKAESDTLFFDNVAASYNIAIESDLPWTASTAYSWIQVSPTSGNPGTSVVSVSVTPNTTTGTREGSVYLRINGKSIKIPVYQRGFYAETSTNCIEFGSHGGAMELSLTTNDTWNASLSDTEWLTLSPNMGEKSTNIILNAKDNPTPSSRNTSLTISSSYSGNIIVDITQNGRFLRASTESVSFFGKGGNFAPIQIYTDAKYQVSRTGDWFSMSETNGIIQVSAGVNNSGNWREGSIVLTATDLTQGELSLVIPITQAIEGLSFSKESYKADIDYNLFNSHGLSITILSYSSDINYNEFGKNGFVKDIYNNRGDINSGNSEGINKDPYADPDNTGNSINKDNYNSDNNYDK